MHQYTKIGSENLGSNGRFSMVLMGLGTRFDAILPVSVLFLKHFDFDGTNFPSETVREISEL